jgi:hypothetical protein
MTTTTITEPVRLTMNNIGTHLPQASIDILERAYGMSHAKAIAARNTRNGGTRWTNLCTRIRDELVSRGRHIVLCGDHYVALSYEEYRARSMGR